MHQVILYSLRLINIANYYWLKWLDQFQPAPAWTRELGRYFQTKPTKILAAYRQKQPQANNLWEKKNRNSLTAIFSFYRETDYFIYRQCFYNRFNAWWELAWLMRRKPKGRLLEYGAGIGPVTNWLIKNGAALVTSANGRSPSGVGGDAAARLQLRVLGDRLRRIEGPVDPRVSGWRPDAWQVCWRITLY